jgi:asparagine synthase (glutamine-hydrolysing)
MWYNIHIFNDQKQVNDMSGIAGIFHFQPQSQSETWIQNMTDVIRHRGLDDVGFYRQDGVLLGCRLLSIIDREKGHQPLSSDDSSMQIIFNGEIYNYKTLRSDLELRGHSFRTKTDTEVILKLYQEFGEQCVHKLRGMFAFILWDQKRQQIFGARDHFGIKPFYYYLDQEKMVMASEIKSILAIPGIERTVRTESVYQYLSFQYVPEPNTMFENIKKLPHGHYFTIARDGKLHIQQYWDPQFAPTDRALDELVEELRERLYHSVEYHMQSEVSRGCFLSSGLDSTAIAAYMHQKEKIKTFSVGFEGADNEAVISSDTAFMLGTEHYAKMISEREFFDAFDRALWHQDEPLSDPSAVALYLVAQFAKKHVTVILSGEGADELFGGYRSYKESGLMKMIHWLPESLQHRLHRLVASLPTNVVGRNALMSASTPLEQRYFGNNVFFSEEWMQQLFAFDRGKLASFAHPREIVAPFYDKSKHLDSLTRMQYIDLQLALPGDTLIKADKMSMAHSLELRAPFLDKELFELARQIPAKYRISDGSTKTILRKSLSGIVPETILQRPKLGFPVPFADWLRGTRGLQMWEEIKASSVESIFQLKQIEDWLRQHQAGQADHSQKLWLIYNFAKWQSKFIHADFKTAEVIQTQVSELV